MNKVDLQYQPTEYCPHCLRTKSECFISSCFQIDNYRATFEYLYEEDECANHYWNTLWHWAHHDIYRPRTWENFYIWQQDYLGSPEELRQMVEQIYEWENA